MSVKNKLKTRIILFNVFKEFLVLNAPQIRTLFGLSDFVLFKVTYESFEDKMRVLCKYQISIRLSTISLYRGFENAFGYSNKAKDYCEVPKRFQNMHSMIIEHVATTFFILEQSF